MTRPIRYPLPKEKVEMIEMERQKFIKKARAKINKTQFFRIGIKIVPIWERRFDDKKVKVRKR